MSGPDTILAAKIDAAFGWRAKPESVVKSGHPATFEYDEARCFEGLAREDVTSAFLAQSGDGFAFLDGEAFAYYLPAVLLEDLRSGSDLVDGLIIGLDRSPVPEYWDDYFLERWPRLTTEELDAVKDWVLWLSAGADGRFAEDSLMRAYETLDLLRQRRLSENGAGGRAG